MHKQFLYLNDCVHYAYTILVVSDGMCSIKSRRPPGRLKGGSGGRGAEPLVKKKIADPSLRGTCVWKLLPQGSVGSFTAPPCQQHNFTKSSWAHLQPIQLASGSIQEASEGIQGHRSLGVFCLYAKHMRACVCFCMFL